MGRLDDLRVEAGGAAEVGQHGGHAALAQGAILRIVGAIDDAAPPAASGACTSVVGGVSARRGDRRSVFPPAQPCRLFLHTSVGWSSASWNSRISARFFCASGVSGGIFPSGGSTISEVRRPVGLCVVKMASL